MRLTKRKTEKRSIAQTGVGVHTLKLVALALTTIQDMSCNVVRKTGTISRRWQGLSRAREHEGHNSCI